MLTSPVIGITAKAIKHIDVAIIGAKIKTILSAAAGMMSSFSASFTPSAKDCNKPNFPTRFGPVRSCILAKTRRSVQTANKVEMTQIMKTISALTAISQTGS